MRSRRLSPRTLDGPLRSALRISVALLAIWLLGAPSIHAAGPYDSHLLVYSTEGNRLRRYDVDTIGAPTLVEDILIERASVDPVDGRDVNGMICPIPDGSGRFLAGEDTDQGGGGGDPIPQGWGIFDADG